MNERQKKIMIVIGVILVFISIVLVALNWTYISEKLGLSSSSTVQPQKCSAEGLSYSCTKGAILDPTKFCASESCKSTDFGDATTNCCMEEIDKTPPDSVMNSSGNTTWDFLGFQQLTKGLLKHNVDCTKGSLTQFRLESKSNPATDKTEDQSNMIRYNYNCKSYLSDKLGNSEETTALQDNTYSIINLEEHPIDCKDSAIQQFQLYTPENDKLQYKYRCSSAKHSDDCTNKETNWNESQKNNWNVRYLDRHNVKCTEDRVLTKVQLETNDNNQVRYKYTCCK